MYIATACTYTYFPGEQYPPPKKKTGGPPSAGTTSGEPGRSSARGGRGQYSPGTQPQGVQTRGCDRGWISPPRRRPQECGQHRQRDTDRGTQTEGHRQRDTDRGTQTEGHRQRDTDRGTQTEGRVANVTKGIRPVRYGQRTLVSVVEPLSGQPCGLSVGKGSSYAATDSYGDESSRQRT